jgi:hypothetical protein
MDTLHKKVKFNKSTRSILFDEKNIVDMSNVQQSAYGKVYSGVTEDFVGTEIRLMIEDSDFPFNIELASFSPAGLVMAIVKNRLEVEGMVASDEIQAAYEYISDSIRL